jgi:uncharacterized protein (TIGR02246 family)
METEAAQQARQQGHTLLIPEVTPRRGEAILLSLVGSPHRIRLATEATMSVQTPGEIHQRFATALNAGDLESLVALYETDAKLIPQPGQVVTGKDAIRAALQGFLAMRPKIRIETQNALQAGDVALLRSKWNLTGKGPDGKSVEMSGNAIEVVRKQPNGVLVLCH